MNFAGVRAVADVLILEFTALGFEAGFIEGAAWDRAGHLVAKHPVANASPKLLVQNWFGELERLAPPR